MVTVYFVIYTEVTLTAITGDNSFLSLYSGGISSQQDFINIMKNHVSNYK